MANRRGVGGMGGRMYSSSSSSHYQGFQQPSGGGGGGGGGGYSSGLNPWQQSQHIANTSGTGGGGTVGGGGGGGGGTGLLSTITNPQQLALALTNLLQPQQQPVVVPHQQPIHQHHHQQQPPPLLSLNTRSPAFSRHDRDSYRFGGGGGGGGGGVSGGRNRSDFRRNSDSYVKSRDGGWRSMDNDRSRRDVRRHRSPIRRSRSRSRTRRTRHDEEHKEKSPKPQEINNTVDEVKPSAEITDIEKVAQVDKPIVEEQKVETTVNSKKDDEDEERNCDHHKSRRRSRSIDRDIESGSSSTNKYLDIPAKYLHCFVCNKDMWDGESFEKHVKGRAHKQMFQSLEESFHVTVNILREHLRLAEEKKMIELNRMHRLNRRGASRQYNEPESHCNMCDLKFLGKIISHRKTEGHQRLKRFLHPSCHVCNKEFPSRMDWVAHRLTPEHLKQLNDVLEKKVGGENGQIIVVPDEEDHIDLDLEPILNEGTELEEENPIVEISDDLTSCQNRMPAFKSNRPVGTKNVIPFVGFMCDLCDRSFRTEHLAQLHLRSEIHYHAFVGAVKEKYKQQTEMELDAKEAEGQKRKSEEESIGNDSTNENSGIQLNENDFKEENEEACNDHIEEQTNEDSDEQGIINSEVNLDNIKEEAMDITTRNTTRNTIKNNGIEQSGVQVNSTKNSLSTFRIPKLQNNTTGDMNMGNSPAKRGKRI